MKRTGLMLMTVALFGLTACADQPAPEAPNTAQTAAPSPANTQHSDDVLPTEGRVVRMVESVLPSADNSEVHTGAQALEATAFHAVSSVDADVETGELNACLEQLVTHPDLAVHGTATAQDTEDTTTVSALGFFDPAAAEAFTTQLQETVSVCGTNEEQLTILTHHTDEAFSIQDTREEEAESSTVVVRNARWVLVTSSQPASDVALALTTVDQLDEMLR